MKKLILLPIFILLFSVLATAADVKFTTVDPIVSDVPFTFDVEMNSQDEPVARIQFYVTSENLNVFLATSSLSGDVWLKKQHCKQQSSQRKQPSLVVQCWAKRCHQ